MKHSINPADSQWLPSATTSPRSTWCPDRYDAMLEAIGALHLVRVVRERLKQKGRAIEVSLDELLGGITAKNLPSGL